MGADYHYSRDGQSFGPVTVEQLRQLAAQGQISGTDLVWKEGMAEWVPAARFKGLIPAAPAPVAPLERAPVVPPAVVASSDEAHEFRLSEPAPAPVMPPAAAFAKPTVKSEPIDDATQAEVFARQAKEVALAASNDALKAFKTLATNPIGGLRSAVDSLGAARAMQAGIVFAVIFELCVVPACRSWVRAFCDLLAMASASGRAPVEPSGFAIFIKTIFIGLVPFGVCVGGFAAARAVFKGRGTWQSDMFVAGAALIPAAVAALVAWILGPYNADVVWVFFVFAATTIVLLLYSGLTTLEGIPDWAAMLTVPLLILAIMYICKIIAVI